MKMFKDKNILITGGSGFLGRELLKRITGFKRLVVFSRSPREQLSLREKYHNVEFVLGDLKDLRAVKSVVKNMDIVIHAGAIKYVDLAEVQPRECVLTNILGSLNVLEAVEEEGNVEVCIGISTDKVVYARSVYGASKYIMEKLFIEANRNSRTTKYCCFRGGNIKGSTGSVYAIWAKQKKAGLPITITNPDMTRYFFSADEAVDLIFYAIENTKGGEIFTKQMPSYRMGDLVKEFAEGEEIKIIGLREGESMHENLVADYEKTERDGDIIIIRDTL